MCMLEKRCNADTAGRWGVYTYKACLLLHTLAHTEAAMVT